MFTYFVLLTVLIAFNALLILRKLEEIKKENKKNSQYLKQRLTKEKTRSLRIREAIENLKKNLIW